MANKHQAIRNRIADIDRLLATGAKSMTIDGVKVDFDPEALRAERRRLEQQLPDRPNQRPRFYRPTLG